MSFGAFEESRAKARPVNLFLFRYGEAVNSQYGYTDSTQDLVHEGVTYRSVAIQRGAIVVKGSMDRAALEIRMALNLEIAEQFRVYPPAGVVSVIIKQGHIGDPANEFLVVWAGRVIAAKRESPELILTCETSRTALKRVGLRRNYQYSCPHVLYGEQCNASKAAATVTGTVTAMSGYKITLASGWNTRPVAEYVGGMVEWDNAAGDKEIRTIVRISSNVLTLSGPLRDLTLAETISVVRGCARNMAGCNTHSNILNFGGCPYIPTKNPVSNAEGNQFY